MFMIKRFTIIRIRKIPSQDVNQELQWLGNALGLFNLRDKESSCFRVFITLVKRAKNNEPISSDGIAEKLDLSRSTVLHHLNRLVDAGIVVREKGGFALREANLSQVVKNIHQDVETTFSELQKIADEIDKKLGY